MRRDKGSVYEYPAKSGRWFVDLPKRDDDGRTIGRTRRMAGNEAAARDLLDELATKIRKGENVDGGRQRLSHFLPRWQEIRAQGGKLRPSTIRREEQLVRVHLVPSLGRYRVDQLRPEHVDLMLGEKRAAGLSPKTLQHIRQALRKALAYAQSNEYTSRNAAALSEAPASDPIELRPLTPDEAKELLDTIRGDRLEPLYVVALSLGLRQGEALGLQWSDVDLEARSLSVRRALQKIAGEYRLVDVKTKSSRRALALPGPVVDQLRAHRDRQLEERKKAPFWEVQWGGLVFATPTGGPLHGPTVTRRLQAILAAAGRPRQRFHDLRHAAASLMLAQGVAPRVIMETLGHATIGITMNTYVHVAPDLQREAADRMGSFLSSRSPTTERKA